MEFIEKLNLMNEVKEIINNYINSIITLKIFEDRIVTLMETKEDEVLDDILEDIAYTTKGKVTSGLISENELKEKLKEYLKAL